jgi:hypothetical protein
MVFHRLVFSRLQLFDILEEDHRHDQEQTDGRLFVEDEFAVFRGTQSIKLVPILDQDFHFSFGDFFESNCDG